MNEIDIINLITSDFRIGGELPPNIEKTKFIINFKYKTCRKYTEQEIIGPREKIYEFARSNCSMSLILTEEF